jgi:lipoate-protein ligase A
MRLMRTPPAATAAAEMATSHALLRRVAAGELPPTLRLYRPAPTVAFGKLDAVRPGYPAAVERARAAGFEAVLRLPGGHAAAYHEQSLGIDLVLPAADPVAEVHDRFAAAAALLAEALRTLGVDARVGEVPGEYCPGAYSVNAAGAVKLVGTGQRVVRGAALLGAAIVVRDGAEIRAVLRDVYAALGIEWSEATAGSVDEQVPGASVGAVDAAVAAAYGGRYALEPAELDPATARLARELEPQHALRAGDAPARR